MTEPKTQPTKKRRSNAETMAKGQREISVSEFFAKNRHLLGFDNPRKALLTSVKEAVDNALDACEEAGILPDLVIRIEELGSTALRAVDGSSPGSESQATRASGSERRATQAKESGSESRATQAKSSKYRLTVGDNGPGIVRKQVENIFGKLLYGSKFHRLKMSRGQQGIGISAAGMYGLMTTGKPMVIHTKPSKRKPAHHIELAMDTAKNKPEVSVDIETDDFPKTSTGTGTQVAIELEAKYVRGKASVEAYLEQTAIANPHAQIVFYPPKRELTAEFAESAEGETGSGKKKRLIEDPAQAGSEPQSSSPSPSSANSAVNPLRTIENGDRIVYPRTVDELPEEPKEIKPHPYGVELGTFLTKLKQTKEKQLAGFLRNEFCRVPPAVIKEVTANASTKSSTITSQTYLTRLDHAAGERIYKALQNARLRAPPTDCLSPIGVRQMLAGLLKGVKAEFYAASTRNPAVYRGNPFQIEAAIAFGGDLPGDEPARVIRFANRVPLLYQQSSCSAFKSVLDAGWRNYGISQPRGAAPVGPLVIMIHMASVWVPFTSESKEAIADYDEIRKEMRLALQECGRKLGTYLRKRKKMRREGQRRDVFERYIGEIARSCEHLIGTDAKELYDALMRQAKRRTEIADAVLDEDGKVVKNGNGSNGNGKLDRDEGVIIVPSDDEDGPTPTLADAPSPSPNEPEAQARKDRPRTKKSGKKRRSKPNSDRSRKQASTGNRQTTLF